jgi:hypothetical protein
MLPVRELLGANNTAAEASFRSFSLVLVAWRCPDSAATLQRSVFAGTIHEAHRFAVALLEAAVASHGPRIALQLFVADVEIPAAILVPVGGAL